MNNGLLGQTIDNVSEIAARIAPIINKDVPASQIARAIRRYDMSFMPIWRTISYTFAATSALSGLQTINLDGNWGYFFTGIAGQHVSNAIDTDAYLRNIQIDGGNNFIPDPLPFALLTRFTGQPLEMAFYAPANAALQTQFQNGSTTAAATFRLTYFGYKAPISMIDTLKKQF